MAVPSLNSCTYDITGLNHQEQYYAQCLDCFPVSNEGACLNCLVLCHPNHKLGPLMRGLFYCDCGFKKTCCRISKPAAANPTPQPPIAANNQSTPSISWPTFQPPSTANQPTTGISWPTPQTPSTANNQPTPSISWPTFQPPSTANQSAPSISWPTPQTPQTTTNSNSQQPSWFTPQPKSGISWPTPQPPNSQPTTGTTWFTPQPSTNSNSQPSTWLTPAINSNEKDIAELKMKVELLWKVNDMCPKCSKHKMMQDHTFSSPPTKTCPGCRFKTI